MGPGSRSNDGLRCTIHREATCIFVETKVPNLQPLGKFLQLTFPVLDALQTVGRMSREDELEQTAPNLSYFGGSCPDCHVILDLGHTGSFETRLTVDFHNAHATRTLWCQVLVSAQCWNLYPGGGGSLEHARVLWHRNQAAIYRKLHAPTSFKYCCCFANETISSPNRSSREFTGNETDWPKGQNEAPNMTCDASFIRSR